MGHLGWSLGAPDWETAPVRRLRCPRCGGRTEPMRITGHKKTCNLCGAVFFIIRPVALLEAIDNGRA